MGSTWLSKSIRQWIGGYKDEAQQEEPERNSLHSASMAQAYTPYAHRDHNGGDQEIHLQNHVRFLLLGATGSGKSATIQHLFGHNNDLSQFGLRSADGSSVTRETVEYELKFRRKTRGNEYHLAETITLGIVDTPGLEDTDGEEQDARNLASIKKFVDQHCRERPNLILFILKADGTRDFGPKSVLARCIRIYFGGEGKFDLTEGGSNVVIVLTHALNICNTSKTWGSEAKKKIAAVENFVKKETGWRKAPPVVVLENKIDPLPDGMTRTGEWTVFPDKHTWQPKHLFHAIAGVLDANNDGLSKSFLDALFERTSENSSVTVARRHEIAATLAEPEEEEEAEEMTSLESYYLDLLRMKKKEPNKQKSLLGQSAPKSDSLFPLHLYSKGKKLGAGSMGKVTGYDIKYPKENPFRPPSIAVKKLKDSKERIVRGHELMAQMEHDNLIKSFGFSDKEKIHWVMEKCDTSLKVIMDYVDKKGRSFHIAEIRAILLQILTGLSFLHSQRMMHRDLKPSNILVNSSKPNCDWHQENLEDCTIKIADCDYVRTFNTGHQADTDSKTSLGTFKYLAPELTQAFAKRLGTVKYTFTADIYSVGIVAYELFAGFLDTNEVKMIRQVIERDQRLAAEPSLKDVLLLMLDPDGANRPGAADLLRRPFFTSSDCSSAGSISNTEHSEGPLLGKGYNLEGEGKLVESCQVFATNFLDRCTIKRGRSNTVETSIDSGNLNGMHGSTAMDRNPAGSKICKVLLSEVTFSSDFKPQAYEKCNLSSGMLGALDKLPSKYNEKNQRKFAKFFTDYGHGFVKTGYYGGEARIWPGVGMSGLLQDGVQTISGRVDGGYGLKVTFRGGDRKFHKPECLEQWKDTVADHMEELILDVKTDIELYQNFVASLDWLKNKDNKSYALEEAFNNLYPLTRQEVVKQEEGRNKNLLDRVKHKLRLE